MSDEPFNDELLSAFLDDELSPEERARVERQLATDPAARQLVDQLRAVSRSVQALPQESVGVDLRDAILERAQRTVRATASEDADLGRPTLRFSVGRSKRGWAYAGLAVAAALLIMFFQPPAEQENGVPGTVALRDRAERSGSGGDAEWRAAPASATPPAESAAELAVTSGEDNVSDRLAGARREMSAEPSAGFGAGGGGVGGALAGASSAENSALDELAVGESPASVAEDQLVVVHVQLKPAAFRAKAFDGVLLRNGIALEEPAGEEERSALSAESAVAHERGRGLEEQPSQSPQSAQQLDAVLVDAPAPQIESCLVELDADKENYLAVAVDEESLAKSKGVVAKQLAAAQSWQKYNRGNAAQRQKLPFSPKGSSAEVLDDGLAVGVGNFRGGQAAELLKLRQRARGDANLGRAMRVPVVSQQEGESLAESARTAAPASPSASNAPNVTGPQLLARDGESPSADADLADFAAESDSIQVLFFLCADPEPAPSLPAENRAE